MSPSDVTDCVAYLSQHALPIRCPRYSPEELSERLARHGATYSPETLLAACEQLGWPTPVKNGRVVLAFTVKRPMAKSTERGDGEQVINARTLAALAEALRASTTRDIPG